MTTLLTQLRSDVKDDIEALLLFVALGDDNTTPTVSDTALGGELFRKAIVSTDKSAADTIIVSGRIESTEANNNSVKEIGWFDTGSEQVDDCESITGWNDSADMTVTLNTSIFMQGIAAINLTKDGTSSADVDTSKTTTSRDFTGKKFSKRLRIVDAAALAKLAATNALTIRYGSDSSNYFEYQFDRSELTSGTAFNYINNLQSGNADSTTGSPVLTAMDFTLIRLTATGSGITWGSGDFIMDDIILTSGILYDHDIVNTITKTDNIILFPDTSIQIEVIEF